MSSNNTSRTSSRNANNSPATSSARSPSHSSVDMASLLNSLNPAQLKAVEHDSKIPLQILAGPGSGKTKVLTSRIARLILTHKLPPKSICAVTFTNKAANEMRERLTKILGKEATNALQMGTFHSICAKFLRQHSHQVGLGSNFTICDADESKKLIGALLKPYKDYLNEHNISITEMFVASVISKAKAKGQSAAMYFEEVAEKERFVKRLRNDPTQTEEKSVERIAAEVFHGYEEVLKRNNALDFDDLLVYGVDLFNKHAESVLWCRHILVDEFQDTNTMQYELMKAIAIKKCVTIVGDPDQSIYGWRSAEVGNLAKMRKDFPGTQQIFLEQNYRSTASILRSSLAIITEDKKRIPKSLHTSHPLGSTPLVREFPDEKQEAAFIAFEIKRVVANMGGTLRWGDFVVLLRFNALSRPIESALQMEGIPCRILGGHKFFERMEVKDILSYLQLVDNPEFNPAFVRAIKVPARGTGDKTLAELSAQAENLKISQLYLVEKIHDNKVPDVKPPVKRKIVSFIKIIRSLRELDKQNTPPSDMIRKLVDMLDYEAHLKKTQQDWESRWENVQELITFASEVEKDISARRAAVAENSTNENTDTPLRQFLQASMLSSEGDNQSEEESKEKVTLSTCHAAKGLEWPVVIIPSVDQDTFPFYRSEDLDEERRLLYVACTRAQTLLYLLHATERQVAGKTKKKLLSAFISAVQQKNPGFFSYDIPRFLSQDRDVITGVLSRPSPKESEIERMLTELAASGARVQSAFQGTNGVFSAVSLTGVKMANDEEYLPSLYASPDALAQISETWLKDYKKPAFSKASKYMSSSLKASMPAFSVAGILNLPGRGPGSSFATPQRSTAYAQPQIAETSRQGAARSNTVLTLNQPASNQHNNWLSSGSANRNNNVVKAKFYPEGADRERHQTSQYTRLPSHTIQPANQIASRLDNFDQRRPSGSTHQNIPESSRQGGFCSRSDQRSNENQQLSPERSVFSSGHGSDYIDMDVDGVEVVERITPNSRTPQSSKKKSPIHLSPSRNGSTRTNDFCLDSGEVEFVENRPYSDSMQAAPRTSPSKTPASPSFASTSSPLPSARQSQHPPAPNGVFNEKPRANANTYSNVHSEKRNTAGSSSRLAGQTRTFGQPAMNLNYDSPRDSDDNAPRSVCSSLSETPSALKDKRIPPVSYDTKFMEDGAIGTPPMISPQRNNLRSQTLPHASPNASNTSHATSQSVPQTIPQVGVKRRLGMGRSVTGYSNKKFKKPL